MSRSFRSNCDFPKGPPINFKLVNYPVAQKSLIVKLNAMFF